MKRRNFSKEFKLRVLSEVQSGRGVAEVARQYQLHPEQISSTIGYVPPAEYEQRILMQRQAALI
ncbi:MAG TPA: transposase [Chloroflexota bacterium]|nr:transposase [Chloroflexota bacterium]